MYGEPPATLAPCWLTARSPAPGDPARTVESSPSPSRHSAPCQPETRQGRRTKPNRSGRCEAPCPWSWSSTPTDVRHAPPSTPPGSSSTGTPGQAPTRHLAGRAPVQPFGVVLWPVGAKRTRHTPGSWSFVDRGRKTYGFPAVWPIVCGPWAPTVATTNAGPSRSQLDCRTGAFRAPLRAHGSRQPPRAVFTRTGR